MSVWVLNYDSGWVWCLETIEEQEFLIWAFWRNEFMITVRFLNMLMVAMAMVIMVIIVVSVGRGPETTHKKFSNWGLRVFLEPE